MLERTYRAAAGEVRVGRAALSEAGVRQAVAVAAGRICPVWDVKSFIAANALHGFEDRPFREAAEAARAYFDAEALMPASFYLEQYRAGRIGHDDLVAAAREFARSARRGRAEELAERVLAAAEAASPPPPDGVRTLAERIDRALGTRYDALALRELTKWCAAYFDQGQAAWPMPGRDGRLYDAWRRLAGYDRACRVAGAGAFNEVVAGLPEAPEAAVAGLLASLGVPADECADYLTRHLARLPGWSGYVKCQAREGAGRGDLTDLLAMSLAYEWSAVLSAWRRLPRAGCAWEAVQRLAPPAAEDEARPGLDPLDARLIWQAAYERGFRRALLAKVAERPAAAPADRPDAQAVFCIDVRSEALRRHLERQGRYETVGFAGFFGFPIRHVEHGADHGTARCPALLTPKFVVEERPVTPEAKARRRFARALAGALGKFKAAAVSSFTYVESLGLLFGAAALGRAALPRAFGRLRALGGRLLAARPATRPVIDPPACGCANGPSPGIPLDDQVATARAALTITGLGGRLARVVLLCGHGSTSENNPYASALDCGACGGHEGKANARVAALAFNSPAVRAGLAASGLAVPADTWFVAAQHDTTTDAVTVFDEELVPPSHRADLDALKAALARAGDAARAEREARLPGPGAWRRSRDWAEVRPEWGLAGNAAFVVGPRALTAAADLGGRVFLHSYDHRADPDGGALEVILTAPLVVAEWINMQYYLSTVDNRRFGAGDKALHNVAGRLGVMQGNQSDLLTGLPLQSVSDGRSLAHEPLRLTALVEAPRGRVESALARHDSVRRLVENEWITLVALEPADGRFYRYRPGGEWLPEEDAAEAPLPLKTGGEGLG